MRRFFSQLLIALLLFGLTSGAQAQVGYAPSTDFGEAASQEVGRMNSRQTQAEEDKQSIIQDEAVREMARPQSVTVNPAVMSFLSRDDSDDETEGDEEKKDSPGWLIEGVLRLSGRYEDDDKNALFNEEESSEQLFETIDPSDPNFFIKHVALLREKQRMDDEEKQTLLLESREGEPETDFLPEEGFLTENLKDNAPLMDGRNPFLEALAQDKFLGQHNFASDFSRSPLDNGSSWMAQLTPDAGASSLTSGESNLPASSDNPFLANMTWTPPVIQNQQSVENALNPIQQPGFNTTVTNWGETNTSNATPEPENRRYIPEKTFEEKYFPRQDRF